MIDWEDLVLETAERFGGTIPHPDTAEAIAAVYRKAPTAVLRAIDRVASEHQDGAIRSPWGILKSRVAQIQTSERTTKQHNDRDKAIERARQWIRTAGLHYDRETEIRDELFGDRGMLKEHADDATINAMVDLWIELRPLGELVEHEAEQRGLRHQQQRAELDKTRRAAELAAQAVETGNDP